MEKLTAETTVHHTLWKTQKNVKKIMNRSKIIPQKHNMQAHLDFMKKKLIILIIRSHKFGALDDSFSASAALEFDESLDDRDLLQKFLFDGCMKSKQTSSERESKGNDLL